MRKYLITFLLSQDDTFYHEDTDGIKMEANDLKELFNLIGDVETDEITSSRIVRAVEESGLVFDSDAPRVRGEFNEDGIQLIVWEDEDYRFNHESSNLH
jgi:hypothetical protein